MQGVYYHCPNFHFDTFFLCQQCAILLLDDRPVSQTYWTGTAFGSSFSFFSVGSSASLTDSTVKSGYGRAQTRSGYVPTFCWMDQLLLHKPFLIVTLPDDFVIELHVLQITLLDDSMFAPEILQFITIPEYYPNASEISRQLVVVYIIPVR